MEADGAPRKAIRSALRHRDFRFLVVAQTVSSTGDWLYTVALIAYVLDRTHSAAWVGLASAIRFAPYVVFSTFGGLVADRFDRRRVMIAMDLAQGLMMIGLTIVAAANGAPIVAIVLAAGSTTFSAFYLPCSSASTPALVGEEDLAGANAIISTVSSLALALGPALGGLLLLLGSSTTAFAVNAITFFVSAAFTVPIRTKLSPVHQAGADEPTNLRRRLGQGLKAMSGSATVQVVFLLSVGFMLFYGLEIVLYPLASARRLGLGAHGIGFMFAAIGIGGLLSAGTIGRVSRSSKQGGLLTIAAIVSGLPMIALAFLRVPALAYLVLGFEGVAFVVGDVLSVTMLQRILDPKVLGRVMGIMDAVMVVAILAGSLLAPFLVQVAGLPAAMVLSGLLLVAMGALVLPRARELDRRSVTAAAELAPRVEALRQLGIFEATTTQALEALAAASREVDVPAGTRVIREGDEPDDLYVVLSGTLNVTSVGEGTHERAIRVLHPEDYFGEIGLLERITRTATVTAATACRLLQISGEDFLRIVNEGAPVAGLLRAGVAARLARTHPSSELGRA